VFDPMSARSADDLGFECGTLAAAKDRGTSPYQIFVDQVCRDQCLQKAAAA
jgi:hypothetical protein